MKARRIGPDDASLQGVMRVGCQGTEHLGGEEYVCMKEVLCDGDVPLGGLTRSLVYTCTDGKVLIERKQPASPCRLQHAANAGFY